MLETNLTRLFQLEAAAEEPAAEINIPAARHTARIRRYWHRTLVIATPVMAAGAVVAIVAGAALLSSGPTARLRKPGPVMPTYAAGFDPTRIYASFGSLPAGTYVAGGGTSRTEDALGTRGALVLSLYVHQPGRCWLQSTSGSSLPTELHCTVNSPNGRSAVVTGRAPDIGGHSAYWATNSGELFLIWTYSAGGWAELGYLSSCPSKDLTPCIRPAEVVEVARHARIGFPVSSILFPAVLTRVPTDWQVATTDFTVEHGRLLANGFQITAGPAEMAPASLRQPANVPFVSAVPVSVEKQVTDAFCHGYDSFPGDRHPQAVSINGYHVLTGYVASAYPPLYQACSPDATGLLVFVYQIGAHPTLSVTAIFSRLHFLGTEPADWTTRPVG